jgi:pimeloyl-ACP methyl ester carboxylesterase
VHRLEGVGFHPVADTSRHHLAVLGADVVRVGVAGQTSGNDEAVADRLGWQTAMVREARTGSEFAAFAVTAAPLLAMSRRGDGHAVLVLPGLGGSDASTAPLRWFLDRLGYRSYGWGLGSNRGFGRHVIDGLDERLTALRGTGPVTLIGWSLGGVHAIELARRRPSEVRSIITLGSPLVGRKQPPALIPTTSVYSRTDAIVSWRASLLPRRALHENVEVAGSHLGLGHNPAVAIVVADRLAQDPESWQTFQPPRWARRWLPAA